MLAKVKKQADERGPGVMKMFSAGSPLRARANSSGKPAPELGRVTAMRTTGSENQRGQEAAFN